MTATPSTPTSPVTPRRKRRSTRVSGYQSLVEPPSPTVSQNGLPEPLSHSRKSSQSSFVYSSSTIRPTSARSHRAPSSRLSIGSNISVGLASNAGFGNLADELEEAWDPDDAEESSFLQDVEDTYVQSPDDVVETRYTRSPKAPRSPITRHYLQPDKPTSPSKQWASMGTQRKTESLYDGSDYGPSEDDEAFDHIAPMLQRRIHDVEEIIRISSNVDSVSESGGVVTRTTKALREDLGQQAVVESGTTRLITAYTSMNTHRTHQAREILNGFHTLANHSHTSSLFGLPADVLDLLIDDIDNLINTLPFVAESPFTPNMADPLVALQSFAAQSHEMISLMHSLLDTLTENRQHLLNATRRTKAVRDLVDDMQMEEELVDTSIMLIQAGDWDRRCRERHATKAVGDVLEGFRKTWGVDYAEGAWKPSVSSRREIHVR